MKKIILFLIKFYQKFLSPDKSWIRFFRRAPTCKFIPTCSDYAVIARFKYADGKNQT
jgi:hypothetical protein